MSKNDFRMPVTRRTLLKLTGGVGVTSLMSALPLALRSGFAQSPQPDALLRAHGISAFGDLKYPRDFPHFDYVNVHAPKGGTFSQIGPNRQYNQSFLTFNSLNSYILKGDAAQGMERTFASLMVRAGDEPDAMYGLAAESVEISKDGLSYTFHLRDKLFFHDGSRLGAQDVAFSINVLKEKGHPIIRQLTRELTGAEALNERAVKVTFKPQRARDVPLFVASLPIFSKTYYEKKHFDESSLDVPLGSGPYRVGRFEPGRFIEFDRVKDWWGADLPVMRGQNNFDTLRYEFYRDRDVAFEGFTGKNYLFREEFTARTWATRYDFPAAKDGRVKREVLPDDTPSGAQGWFMNTRKAYLADRRVREALILAFDFEWTSKTIMYDAYKRTHSVFQNSDMMANGAPSTDELKLLEPFRAQLTPEVFGAPFVPPIGDGSGQDRNLLRRATQLLNDAGCVVKDGKRMTAKGDPFEIEFLLEEPVLKPHHMPYIKNLGALGIAATLRMVDPVQYRARLDGFDFDLTVSRFSMSSTPGDSMKAYFSSQSANDKGSNNLAGVADPVLDALIEKIIAAPTREALIVACRAFDRVHRAGRYWVPQWYKGSHTLAYWDVFAHPAAKPRYMRGAPETWWYDSNKAARIDRVGQ